MVDAITNAKNSIGLALDGLRTPRNPLFWNQEIFFSFEILVDTRKKFAEQEDVASEVEDIYSACPNSARSCTPEIDYSCLLELGFGSR